MAIEEIKVRAEVIVGTLTTSTPYVLSFSVTRNRGSHGTMSASLKVLGANVGQASGQVTVRAGVRDSLETIFTGDIRKITISPCWEDPSFVILNIEAADVLARLTDTNFSRRQVSEDAIFATIDQADYSYKSGRFNTINEPTKVQITPDKSTQGGAVGATNTAPENKSKAENQVTATVPPNGLKIEYGGTS